MKSGYLIMLVLAVIPGIINAQEGFKIGPTGSVIVSRSSVLDSLPSNFNLRYKTGINIGISAQYGFTPQFILASGLNLTNKGYRVFNDSNGNGNVLRHTLSNLEVPLNAIFKFRMGQSSRMRALLGVSLNYQLSTKEKNLINKNSTFIIKESFSNKIYPLMNFGMELASENKGGNVFVIGIYYKLSLSEQLNLGVYNNPNAAIPKFNLAYRGSYIGLGLSYLFDFENFKRKEEFFY